MVLGCITKFNPKSVCALVSFILIITYVLYLFDLHTWEKMTIKLWKKLQLEET